MLYLDGRAVLLGDRVDLAPVMEGHVRGEADGWIGTVVADFDAGSFAGGYEGWAEGGPMAGCLVACPAAGLVHYEKPDADLVLLARR